MLLNILAGAGLGLSIWFLISILYAVWREILTIFLGVATAGWIIWSIVIAFSWFN